MFALNEKSSTYFEDYSIPGSHPANTLHGKIGERIYLWLCYGLFMVALAFVGLGLYSHFISSKGQSAVVAREYVVKPGDTLYSIALRHSDGSDLNQYLYSLEQEVGPNALIYPGEIIQLPSA